MNYEEFYQFLRTLEIPLQLSIKDLRSQVVREACITIGYLCEMLRGKFDHTAESLLNNLINLIQNSAKVVATVGHVTVRWLLQYSHSPRLIPIITSNLINSKSKEIRRTCCEFLEQILSQWPSQAVERQISHVQEALKKGIMDADPDARASARRAYHSYKESFPDQAAVLLQSLDPSYRKALQGELSSSSSSNSLTQTAPPRQVRPSSRPTTTSHSTTGKIYIRRNLRYSKL